ncbi:RNA polymerase subunit sigma-70 [Actinokineospora globicatena]|uniref:RNA polymerase subunit sigma-70 n=1 Tax=Actinokineospora globicatena TaxID=103729 RepID=UPI0020A599D8|nr:RNA polymerase subunit sigma-70 [Actinokineospora globicatena]MCP2305024.1 RNA polymerase sigma-70 factor, ECF subfamily [Actinokineospora globicatena]GLW80486.1 RNA polymerase sigma factor [Actinokineospora globicatena]GLW87314.1 RNA polymerase sigma factor [Actinokineospora globicatena]
MSDFEQYRRELHVHCYRMLASYEQAEDAVQETFLRAWRGREGFDGANARAWLYKIATNICVDQARTAKARTEVAWLTPYPDRELDEPHVVAVARETIELAFLTALQVLPGRQRAALLAKEVLGLSAAEIADLLGVSVAAANSALQRARTTLRDHLPARRDDWAAREPSAAERDLLARFIDAHERCDAPAALAVAAEDIRVTMPPNPLRFDGRDAIAGLLERAFGPDRDGDWRLLPTSANRMPAAASYLRRPGDTEFRAFKLDVLRVVGGEIAEITTFGYALFDHFGLPTRLV